MIEVEGLTKVFKVKEREVEALKDVSLRIKDGQKFGVIGYSGAGKSTLVRCINFLEIPDCGKVSIGGKTVEAEGGRLYSINGKERRRIRDGELSEIRRRTGMIFQHFNLLDRSTVFDNIAYPLKYTGRSRKEISDKVLSLLSLVSLEDKIYSYPAELSGGQKQRVAIARALANDPSVLLSDEATSALDPDATESILSLLKELNKKLSLTIVLITHEMSVIKSVCDTVAVMENGRVVEEGSVYNIFSRPEKEITKKFVSSTSSLSKIGELIKLDSPLVRKTEDPLFKLVFSDSVASPLISETSRKYSINFNIILANVEAIGNDAIGSMLVRLEGGEKERDAALTYLLASGVKVEAI